MNQKKKFYQNCINLFYHLTILTALNFIFMFSLSCNVWGANIYIDPTYVGTERGTFEKPYNSWNDIVSFSPSDDYRQKCGTTYTGTLTINTSGNSSNYITIGAYYDLGGAVHEDADPSFGATCGNLTAKPIIRGFNNSSKTIRINAQYITISSIEVQYGNEAIKISDNYNIIEYCRIGKDSIFGVRVGVSGDTGGNNNTIRYNIIDLHDPTHKSTQDGINLHRRAANNLVYNNYITRCGHGGVFFNNGDSNDVYNNYIANTEVGVLWNFASNYNKVHHNWLETANMQIQGGQYNKVYFNVLTRLSIGKNLPQIVLLNEGQPSSYPTDYNKIYNNLLYNSPGRGIQLYARSNETGGSIAGNEIINNVVLSPANYCFLVNDTVGEISNNVWANNLCYDFGTNQYAREERYYTQRIFYKTANEFNARVDARYNRDDNPGLKNPSAGQFWPENMSSKIVANGEKLSLEYNQVLNPDGTDFNASPPKVKTEDQPVDWYIGAYALPSSGKEIKIPPPSDLHLFK